MDPARFIFSYRCQHKLKDRLRTYADLTAMYPDCALVVLERFPNATNLLPVLDQPNIVVHKKWSVGHFCYKVQRDMGYEPIFLREMYFWTHDKLRIPPRYSCSMEEFEKVYAREDGIIYLKYSDVPSPPPEGE
uniref:Autophagy-related protein 8h n=1 Tax=Cacopsylla melanoneura TaxID=428564 RepID=A0A8D8Z9Y9_9HEMI